MLVSGLGFPEGPRWHEGRLWFSDMGLSAVFALGLDGRMDKIVEVEGRPSGLGWLPDGRLLVVSMHGRCLLRESAPGSRRLVEVARLDRIAPSRSNDMVVDRDGRAYIGNFGFDFASGEEPRGTVLVRVDKDGSAHIVACGLLFPNGMALTPDGTLIVAESLADRLTAFDVEADGSLCGRRVFADIPGVVPDGICLDAEGAVWVASASTGEVVRVAAGGKILERIPSGSRGAYACMLGGPDRRTLFVCSANTGNEEEAGLTREGSIIMVGVDVPGAGLP